MGKQSVLTSSGRKSVGNPDTLTSDVAGTVSAKTITVPAKKTWLLKYIYASMVTTATVGNRILGIQILKADNTVILDIRAAVAQAANLTYRYTFAPNIPMSASAVNGTLLLPIPDDIVLPAGYKIKIWDTAAIAAAADTMNVHVFADEMEDEA